MISDDSKLKGNHGNTIARNSILQKSKWENLVLSINQKLVHAGRLKFISLQFCKLVAGITSLYTYSPHCTHFGFLKKRRYAIIVLVGLY